MLNKVLYLHGLLAAALQIPATLLCNLNIYSSAARARASDATGSIVSIIDRNAERARLSARIEVALVAIVQVEVLNNAASSFAVDIDLNTLGVCVRCRSLDRNTG